MAYKVKMLGKKELEVNRLANVCVSCHRLANLACHEYLRSLTEDSSDLVGLTRLYNSLSDFYELEYHILKFIRVSISKRVDLAVQVLLFVAEHGTTMYLSSRQMDLYPSMIQPLVVV